MHLIQSSKKVAHAPIVPIVSHFKVPFHRRLRGRRFDHRGKFLCETGPKRVIEPSIVKAVKEAFAAAAKMPKPEEGGGFDLGTYHPLPSRILVVRGPQIKEEKGVLLPETKWRHEPQYIVIRVGREVTIVAPGDQVIFHKKHKPKSVRLGSATFYIGRVTALVATLEPDVAPSPEDAPI